MGNSTMVVPTLLGIGIPPPIVLFKTLELLALVLVLFFLAATMVSVCVLVHPPVFQALLYCTKNSCRTQRQCGPGSCCGCMKTVFLFMGRLLCVNTFPALFKMHKTHRDNGSQKRSFMVFLDRKVESSLVLIAAFCSMAYSIFCISTLVFFRYFPVEDSGECLEKDNQGRPLFCYTGSSNSSLPVDCAKYTVTELRGLHFECYSIAIPGFGIAVAAALGLTKVATVGITIFIKLSEAFFNMTKNPPQKLPQWCCCCRLPRTYANKIYIYLSGTLLAIVSALSLISIMIFIFYDKTQPSRRLRYYYSAYMLLPTTVCLPLIYIVKYLEAHCDREEYVSFAADQRPLDPRDWDKESGSSMTAGQQDEASMGGGSGGISSVAPNETEESLLIDTRGNTEYMEFGASHSSLTRHTARTC